MNKEITLPIHEVKIICRTNAPEDVICELGRSQQVQAFRQFTYLDFEFTVAAVDIYKVATKKAKKEKS